MATRGTIAVEHADGTVSQVYSHWDNYPEHNGVLLIEHYNTLEKAEALVALGNISSLRENIEPTGPHTFDQPQDTVTIYYGRDRGEDDQEPKKFWNREMYRLSGDSEEYNYLFADGTWTVRRDQGKWMKVKNAIPA